MSVSVAGLTDDLLTIDNLVAAETDDERRRSLAAIRARIARRAECARLSEAATLLAVSQRTARSSIDVELLPTVGGAKPLRVDVGVLAAIKRALDLVRPRVQVRRPVIYVMRAHDRAALEGADQGVADLQASRVVPLDWDLPAEISRERRQPAGWRHTP